MVGTAPQPIATDEWVPASWVEYMARLDSVVPEARCYFDADWMRVERSPLGALHGREHSIVSTLVVLTNTTFRKTGLQEAQPDIAFYVGQGFDLPPRDNRPMDVLTHGAPQLVIEIASTTLNDDLGKKRLLYERLGAVEYWVVDVQAAQVFGFEIADRRSGQIMESQVLPGLAMTTLEMALERSQQQDDATITRWLLALFG